MMIFTFYDFINDDDLVKSRNTIYFVIPVKTGIQYLRCVILLLDSRLRGNDGFLRVDQLWRVLAIGYARSKYP